MSSPKFVSHSLTVPSPAHPGIQSPASNVKNATLKAFVELNKRKLMRRHGTRVPRHFAARDTNSRDKFR